MKLRIKGNIFHKKIKLNKPRIKVKVKPKEKLLFEYEFKPTTITEETRQDVINNPYKHRTLELRTRIGKFYTDEEKEEYKNKSLNRRLP